MTLQQLRFSTTTALCLAAAGLGACCQTVEQRMISQITERDHNFDAESRYAEYLKQHGESVRNLRKAVAEANAMQVYIKIFRYQNVVEEYLPLTEDETQAVREILENVQAPPLL